MVQYIPGEPTLGGNIGAGISRGLATGMQDFVSRRAEERKEAKRKQELLAKRHQKLGDTATNFVSKYIKEFDPDMPPTQREALQQRYLNFLSQAEMSGQDVDPNHALQMAVNQGKEQEAQSAAQAKPDWKNPATNAPSFEESGLGRLLSLLGERRDVQVEGRKQRDLERGKSIGEFGIEKPMSLLKEIPVGVAKLGEGLVHMGGEVGDLMGMQKVIGMLTGNKQLDIPEIMKRKGALTSEVLAQVMRKGLSEEDSQVAERLSKVYEGLASFIPGLKVYEGLAAGGKAALSGAQATLDGLLAKIGVRAEQFGASTAAREATINAEGILSGSAAKTEAAVEGMVSDAAAQGMPKGRFQTVQVESPVTQAGEPKSLAGKVTEKPPQTGTTTRVAKQAEKPFKTEKELKLRETQLKEHPKYAEEIQADHDKMVSGRAEREPKGPRGLATQAKNQAAAQADLPGVQRVYQDAVARVRALENKLAKNPGDKQIQEVLDVAKQHLEDAEFLHKQTLENAKFGTTRVGKDAMRDAARKKTMEISEKIANGEEVELAKMDYNPERVKDWKALKKRKNLEAKKISDFHTQVHDEYAKIYKQRLGQLDKQITDLAKDKSLASLHQRQVLDKERQVLKKLIEHAEADSGLHRHRLALRERFETKKADSRFREGLKKGTPVEQARKTREAAKGKFDMKKSTQEAANSPEGASKAAGDVSKEAARQYPKQSVQIEIETPVFQKTMSEAPSKSETSTLIRDIADAKTPKEAEQKVSKLINDWVDFWKKAKKLSPETFKTSIAKTFAAGFVSDFLQESFREVTGMKINKGTVNGIVGSIAGLSGFSGGGVVGGGTRGGAATLGMGASHLIWTNIRKMIIRSAAKRGDRDELFRLTKKYGPKLVKEVTDEFR